MRIPICRPLFAWDRLEDSPSLRTIREFLASLPDSQLLSGLREARGRGRNDYPVQVLWGTLLLTLALRHPSFQACLADLHRNRELRRLLGIESESEVPKACNLSRFLKVLGSAPHRENLKEVFRKLVRIMARHVPELGQHTAGDATALNARRQRGEEELAEEEREGLVQPSGGRKEYLDEEGQVTKVMEWFGLKLHLLVDVKHEVALAWQITGTPAGDGETLPGLLAEARADLPAGRMETLAYDKAADSEEVHRRLDQDGIKPLIKLRRLWKDEPERLLPGHDGRSCVVHDEAGTLFCYDKVSEPPVRRKMAFMGYEKDRDRLKYRCPAAHEGFVCASAARCNAGRAFGMIARVAPGLDLRRFPRVPRTTKSFERRYKGRTAMERVNARLKVFWGADDGNVGGARRFHGFLGAVMVVHAGMAALLASAPRYEGRLGQTRLGPIQKALRAELRL